MAKALKVKLNLSLEDRHIWYVEDNFKIHYAPLVAQNCAAAIPHVDEKTAAQLRQIAASARKSIEGWIIRDERDRQEAAAGLEACAACGV